MIYNDNKRTVISKHGYSYLWPWEGVHIYWQCQNVVLHMSPNDSFTCPKMYIYYLLVEDVIRLPVTLKLLSNYSSLLEKKG